MVENTYLFMGRRERKTGHVFIKILSSILSDTHGAAYLEVLRILLFQFL
jgi:hypothetical protein